MSLVRFSKECPGLAGSIARLYGDEVASAVAADYCIAADLGGNVELGVVREEGVSFNPRLARIASLVIQECGDVVPLMVRVALYSGVPLERSGEISADITREVTEVREASPKSPPWIQGVALALTLDMLRHLHMSNAPADEKESSLNQARASLLLSPDSGAPERLRLKVIHALDLQTRRVAMDKVS